MNLDSFVEAYTVTALVMFPIHAYGSKEQKERWLRDLGSGKKIGCFGLSWKNLILKL
mgnify:CR=1 FL=1